MKVSFKALRPDAVVFLSERTEIDFSRADFSNEDYWFCCTARDMDGEVALVIVFEFKDPFDAHFTLAVENKKALNRQLITVLYATVFQRAARVTALIDPENKVALKQVWRMGFKYEGYMRRAVEGVRDAVVFGLLPEECPYLTGEPFTIRWAPYIHPENRAVN